MREGISIEVSAAACERLASIVADRNSRQKQVWRARIILATAEGCGTAEIMRRAGVSKPCVWRWQERFMREGVVGLLRDKTRKPGLPPLPSTLIDRVVALTLAELPDEATHWTGRAMAADPPTPAARRLSLAGRSPGGDQPLSRRAQPKTQTVRLDRRPRPHHRKGQPRVPRDRVRPLAGPIPCPQPWTPASEGATRRKRK